MALAFSEEDDPAEGARELVDNRLVFVYLILAASFGFVAFQLINYNLPEFAIGVIFVVPISIFLAITRTDWLEEVEGLRVIMGVVITVSGLLILNMMYTIYKNPGGLTLLNVLWPSSFTIVPLASTLGVSLGTQLQRFSFDFVSAFLFVAPGEETLKAIPWMLFKAWGGSSRLMFFSLQIPVLLGIAFWAPMHGVRAGAGLDFMIFAFIAGIWIAEVGYWSGNFFTMIASHGILNALGVVQNYLGILSQLAPGVSVG